MKNEFIPYEEALVLKELGFDNVNCLGVYYGNWINQYGEHDIDYEDGLVLNSRDTQYSAQKGFQNGILAPLYQQVFRWFREKYNLYPNMNGNEYYTSFNMTTPKMEILSYKRDVQNHYEEAELACLRKLIEIVNQNKNENNNKRI